MDSSPIKWEADGIVDLWSTAVVCLTILPKVVQISINISTDGPARNYHRFDILVVSVGFLTSHTPLSFGCSAGTLLVLSRVGAPVKLRMHGPFLIFWLLLAY